jgi:glycosyltransferase involved in cell wall biosynthesis
MGRSVAYLTSFYARAGDTFIRREVEELRRLGWTVHTFSIRRADEGEGVSEEILREQRSTTYLLEQGGWKLAAAFFRRAVRSPRRMMRAVSQARAIRWPGLRSWIWHWVYLVEASYLAEQLERRGVGLLHNHISMNSATVALLASTLAAVPFSMTVHGPHDFLAAEHWGLGAKISAAAATVCISDFGKSQCMLFSRPGSWDRLHVVRCGLDGSFLDATTVPLPLAPRLVCVGRLGPEKGQLLLVRAAAILRDRGIAAEIVLVGDGPSRRDIEEEAARLGVRDRIRLEGWQGSSQVRRSIEESRALVLPSLAEGIPVVLMEALALRRPVISTYVGGIPELVRPGENGWLVPAGSVEELARALAEALRAPPEELDRMGSRGRALVLERHDLSREVRKLAEILDRCLSSS